MTAEELESILRIAAKYGVKSIRTAELDVGFFKQAPTGPVIIQQTTAIGAEHGMPTDDEMLFYSSPQPIGSDEIAAQIPVIP